jgi:hypothetical protein
MKLSGRRLVPILVTLSLLGLGSVALLLWAAARANAPVPSAAAPRPEEGAMGSHTAAHGERPATAPPPAAEARPVQTHPPTGTQGGGTDERVRLGIIGAEGAAKDAQEAPDPVAPHKN